MSCEYCFLPVYIPDYSRIHQRIPPSVLYLVPLPSLFPAHRFVECVEQISRIQHMVIQGELSNWRQSQRLFSWEDDTGRLELNTIQHWCESLAELLWRQRQLAKQVCTRQTYLFIFLAVMYSVQYTAIYSREFLGIVHRF